MMEEKIVCGNCDSVNVEFDHFDEEIQEKVFKCQDCGFLCLEDGSDAEV